MEGRRKKDGGEDPDRVAIHVLLIDDDEQDREVIRGIVGRDVAPVEVREVVNHVGFYQALQENQFDVVITEQDLHWSSGREVLTAVKSLRPAVPVIMVAARGDDKVATAALGDGLDAYLSKRDGFPSRLRASLRSALRRIEFEERIESLEERLRDLLDRLDVGVFQASLDGTVLQSNAALERLMGAVDEGSEGRRSLAGVFSDPQVYCDLTDRLASEGRVRSERAEWQRSDGSTVWVSLSATVRPVPGGEKVADGLVEDVTEEHEAREALRRATQDLRAIFEHSGAAVAVLRADGTVEMVNTAFERFSGFACSELEGLVPWNRFMSIADGQHDAERRRVLLAAPESGPRGARFDFVTRHGRAVRVHATEAALPGGERSVVSLVNISERQLVEDRLMHNVFHDGLTGLPNRLSLMDRLGALAGEDGPMSESEIALLVVDVDDFKSVNDRFGHRIGDLLLRSVTRRIEGAAPDADMVARMGSDSFAVVLNSAAGRGPVTAVADAVASTFRDPFQFGDHTLHCTVSMGAAMVSDGSEVATLFRDAETAMYEARRAGGGRWQWHDED